MSRSVYPSKYMTVSKERLLTRKSAWKCRPQSASVDREPTRTAQANDVPLLGQRAWRGTQCWRPHTASSAGRWSRHPRPQPVRNPSTRGDQSPRMPNSRILPRPHPSAQQLLQRTCVRSTPYCAASWTSAAALAWPSIMSPTRRPVSVRPSADTSSCPAAPHTKARNPRAASGHGVAFVDCVRGGGWGRVHGWQRRGRDRGAPARSRPAA